MRKILLSLSQTPGTREKARFRKKTPFRFSSYNSVCRELLWTFLPVGIAVRSEISTVRKIFRFRQNSSKSQPDSWYTRKKRDFEKSTFVVSSYNSVCRELLRTFLPVRITVRAEISTVRKIFRFRQNSSKSQPDSGHKWNNVDFEKRRSRALKAVGTMIPTCPGHFVHKSEANCGGQRPTKKNIGQIWTSSGHC